MQGAMSFCIGYLGMAGDAMAEKRNPGRFTIQFDLGDPQHKQVAQILEGQGRYKARFIANAVMHYLHCSETPDIPQPAPVDRKMLEKIVLDIIGQHEEKKEKTCTAVTENCGFHSEKSSKPVEDIQHFFGDEGMAIIANTLAAFQKT